MSRIRKEAECGFCKQVKKIASKGYCSACYSRLQKTGSLEYKRKGKRSICMIDGCESHVVSNGLCDKHRKRLDRHGHVSQTRPNDWGKRESHPLYNTWANLRRFRGVQLCKEWHSDFWEFVKEAPEKPEGRCLLRPLDKDAVIDRDNCQWIEPLSSKTDDEKEYLKNWARLDREINPDKYRDKRLQKDYGITLLEYIDMAKAQNGKCAICLNKETALDPKTKTPRRLAVDHCHATGKVRGLLCSSCNTALGLLKDDVLLLKRATVYLNSNS